MGFIPSRSTVKQSREHHSGEPEQRSYWYRTVFTVPKDWARRQVWLHFDGANFSSEVWVNGAPAGTIQGAFVRRRFDITKLVKPGETAVLAVKVTPQPHPGVPHEHTIANGVGKNGMQPSMGRRFCARLGGTG